MGRKQNYEWLTSMSEEEKLSVIDLWLKSLNTHITLKNPNRFTDNNLFESIRNITGQLGRFNNLYISEKAEQILGECKSWKDIDRAQKLARKNKESCKTETHHIPEAEYYFNEVRQRAKIKTLLTTNEIRHWADNATMNVITKEEHIALHSNELDVSQLKLKNIKW